jgi:hypothetical protein
VARLSHRADLETDVLTVTGDVVDLVQSWTV